MSRLLGFLKLPSLGDDDTMAFPTIPPSITLNLASLSDRIEVSYGVYGGKHPHKKLFPIVKEADETAEKGLA